MAQEPETELPDWSIRQSWRHLKKPVVIPSVALIVIGLIFASWYGSTQGAEAFEGLNTAVVNGVGWWYVLIVSIFVFFALWAGLSKAGRIRLGRDDEKPEFSLGSWFTMLFAAGMGIGLVYWGVAEPLNHYISPPETTGDVGTNADGEFIQGTDATAFGDAVGQTMFHWGLHAWAIYVVVGLGLAYMTFRRGRPLSMRWLVEPIFGRRLVESWVGHIIDVVAIVGTVFGIVTSLGLGAQQVVGGLDYLGWAESSPLLLSLLVVGIMAIATISLVSGVHKGLKWLSNANMVIAAILALFLVLAGPALFLLQSFVGNIGEYLLTFPQLLFETGAEYAGVDAQNLTNSWSADWTIYYWGWWMSWAPFVGMFIARISRGRTIREFVLGVLLAPTLVCMMWFTVFGSSGLYYQITEGSMLTSDGTVSTDASLFMLLENFPLPSLLSVIAIIVIVIFFITSADSGSLVTDVLAFGGRTETPKITRVFWTALITVTAIVLLTLTTDPDASLRILQVAAISAAAPLSVVYAVAMIAQVRVLRFEARTAPEFIRVRRHATKAALVDVAREYTDDERGTEVRKTLVYLLNRQARTLRGMFGGTSATLAGLPGSAGKAREAGERISNDDLVLAIETIPPHATHINPGTGVLAWDPAEGYQDPIDNSEGFETTEYAESYAGWEHELGEFFDKTIEETGTIPTVSRPLSDEELMQSHSEIEDHSSAGMDVPSIGKTDGDDESGSKA